MVHQLVFLAILVWEMFNSHSFIFPLVYLFAIIIMVDENYFEFR